jgi:SAM-dependent methyltransferase
MGKDYCCEFTIGGTAGLNSAPDRVEPLPYTVVERIAARLRRKLAGFQVEEQGKSQARLHRIRQEELEIIIPAIASAGRESVLDVGSGDGFLSELLQRHFREVLSTDLRKVDRKDIQQVISDARNLPFVTAHFDCVLLSNVLEHIDDRVQTLRESLRVLKEGGVVVVTVPSVAWKLMGILSYPIDLAFVAISRSSDEDAAVDGCGHTPGRNASKSNLKSLLGYPVPRVHGEYHGNMEELLSYRISSWERLFRTAGIDDVDLLGLPLYPFRYLAVDNLRTLLEHLGVSSSSCFIFLKPSSHSAELEA